MFDSFQAYEVPEKFKNEYKSFYENLYISRLNIIYIFTFIFFPGASIFDYLIYPDLAANMLFYRILCAAISSVLMLLSNKTFLKKHYLFMTYLVLINTTVTIIILTKMGGGVNSGYYAGLNLLYLCMAMVAPFSINNSLLGGIIVFFLYFFVIVIPEKNIDWSVTWNNLYFLSFTAAFVIISSGISDRNRKMLFVGHLEAQEMEKNKNLKLKQLETAKKEFISNIAHDLKTPLSIIIGHAALLESSENVDKKTKTYLSYIQQSVSRISYMVDRLITVAFIDEEDKPVLGLYEIYSFINNYVAGFNEIAKNQDKTIYIVISEEDKAIVQIDPLWVERICGNIVHNALKYTQRGASITVKMYQDPTHVFVQIIDTGEGIDADKLPYIFDRKTKYDDTTFRDRYSMGLGLFIVREYIKKLGGKIDVLSEKNKGSTFVFSLPLHPDQTAQVKNAPFNGENRRTGKDRRTLADDRRQNERTTSFIKMIARDTGLEMYDFSIYENRNPSKPTLLIVEDTPGQIHLIIEALKDNFNLIFASNGRLGLEKFQQYREKIALILSDVKMPEMDGFELCKKIFEDKNNEHIPFVFITAYFNQEEEFYGIHLGASDYIQKPINIFVLREKINHWISRRHYETMMEDLNGTLEDKILQINKLQDIISHEIRNPLHVMKGSVYFINKLKEKLPQNDEEILKIFKKIETLSMGMESLISVLDLNKQITEGGSIFDSSLHSLQSLLDEVLQMTSHLLYNTDIRVNRGQDYTLLCNKRMLIEVFVNLIRNAAEAVKEKNPERGHIDLNILPLENNRIEIKLSDNGIGINEETQKNLFKFKYTTKKNGTGIGLHFSKMVIKMHNGTISFNSRINEGTHFLITLPIKINESDSLQRKA